ncbi:MAG: cobalamin B12-binding domain-containing protein [Phycisphaerales bacterium]
MEFETIQQDFFEILLSGDRPAARMFVQKQVEGGFTPQDLITELFWPVYERIDRMFRTDQLAALAHHTATRLLRMLVDQNSARLKLQAPIGRTVFCTCGPSEADEMGGQMAVDLLETYGFTVSFAGGGIANDEILARVNESKPDVLLMFASSPADLPNIRALVDTLGEIGACPNLQIAVGGGVFNRAEGLAEEVGADVWAEGPLEIVDVLMRDPARRASAGQRTVGKNRNKPKRAAA